MAVESLLPTEKSLPSDNIWDYVVLMYGEKKIGKTSMWSHADNTLYCMFEPGGRALEIFQTPIKNWANYLKVLKELTEGENDFNPVVVDTVDIAYEMCLQYVCRKMDIEHPSDAAYGKAWTAVKREFNTQIRKLILSEKGAVFISHATEKEVTTRTGGTYSVLQPSMGNQAKDVMESIVDIIVHYEYVGDQRWLRILGDDHIVAGHRLENNFKFTDGTPVRYIPAGDSSKEAWENFNAAFNNELDPIEPAKLKKKEKK